MHALLAAGLLYGAMAVSGLPRMTAHGIALANAMDQAATTDWVVMRDDSGNVRIIIDLGKVPGWCILPDALWAARADLRNDKRR